MQHTVGQLYILETQITRGPLTYVHHCHHWTALNHGRRRPFQTVGRPY